MTKSKKVWVVVVLVITWKFRRSAKNYNPKMQGDGGNTATHKFGSSKNVWVVAGVNLEAAQFMDIYIQYPVKTISAQAADEQNLY